MQISPACKVKASYESNTDLICVIFATMISADEFEALSSSFNEGVLLHVCTYFLISHSVMSHV